MAGVTITLRRDRYRWDASATRADVPITWGRGPENPSTGRSRPYRTISDPDPRWAAILIADRLGLDQTAVSNAFSAATNPMPVRG